MNQPFANIKPLKPLRGFRLDLVDFVRTGDMVQVEYAVEVLYFMLEGFRHEASGFDLHLFTLDVLPLDGDLGVAGSRYRRCSPAVSISSGLMRITGTSWGRRTMIIRRDTPT